VRFVIRVCCRAHFCFDASWGNVGWGFGASWQTPLLWDDFQQRSWVVPASLLLREAEREPTVAHRGASSSLDRACSRKRTAAAGTDDLGKSRCRP
jgi:hypothetical protein